MRAASQRTQTSRFPSQGKIIDLAGGVVNAEGWTWVLNNVGARKILNWRALHLSPVLMEATARYVRNLIENQAPVSVYNTFNALKKLKNSSEVRRASDNGDVIDSIFFGEMRLVFANSDWQLHYIRDWYRACSDLGYLDFSPEIAFDLEERTVGGNRKGQAVLSLDPEDGPLSDLEITGLLNALNARRHSNTMSLTEKVALWLCIAYISGRAGRERDGRGKTKRWGALTTGSWTRSPSSSTSARMRSMNLSAQRSSASPRASMRGSRASEERHVGWRSGLRRRAAA